MNTFNLKLNFPNLLWEIAGYNFPSLFGKRAILFIFIAISFQVSAQRMAIKTNTLEWLAYALATAIRKIGEYDIIIGGRQPSLPVHLP